jgi:hydrogenase maturation protease
VTCVVVGVGNPYRRDDGVGLVLAERIGGRAPAGVTVLTQEQEPSRLLEAWEGAGAAVVVDAVASGAQPGTLYRFDATVDPVPAGVFRSSTHAFGVGDAIELSRALGSLPPRVVVHGVEGGSFEAGEGLSGAVIAALPALEAAVLADLQRLVEEERCTSAR